MSHILIVEDEPRIASFIAKGLKAAGFSPTIAPDGNMGLEYALTGDFALMVLDLGLPGIDGFEVMARVRAENPDLPVLVLTARETVEDTVRALEGGAIDYMVKPFRFAELVARIKLRMQTVTADTPVTELSVGKVRLDLLKRQVCVDGRPVELSARELALAEILMRHAGAVLSREQLLSHVWGYDFDPGSNVVDVYVGYLRKKLGADFVTTVRGFGYRTDA